MNASSGGEKNILMDIDEKYPGYTHIAIEVTNLNIVQTQLQEKNISITEGPITVPGGAKLLFIRDPDKNVIEFHQPAPQEF